MSMFDAFFSVFIWNGSWSAGVSVFVAFIAWITSMCKPLNFAFWNLLVDSPFFYWCFRGETCVCQCEHDIVLFYFTPIIFSFSLCDFYVCLGYFRFCVSCVSCVFVLRLCATLTTKSFEYNGFFVFIFMCILLDKYMFVVTNIKQAAYCLTVYLVFVVVIFLNSHPIYYILMLYT